MIYEYLDTVTGERVEIVKPAAQADPIDSVLTIGGRELRRIASVETQLGVPDEARVRQNLPRWMPGAPAYDKNGWPVLSSAQGRKMGLVENPHLDNPEWR